MTPHDLLTNFETLAEAPNGIQRLRELVLELAVRGKLVEQDPEDEPAAEILRRIQTAKTERTASARRSGVKAVPVSEDERPFEIPPTWAWTRAAQLGVVNPRNNGVDEDPVAFVPMAVLSTDYRAEIRPDVRLWKEIKKGYTHIADGDIAIAKITPCFENGKAAVFERLPGGYGAGTTELHVLRPIPGAIDPHFILLFFKSPTFITGGVATMTGTAGQQRVSGDYFTSRPVPLPPLLEQCRIVARVDELMALLDRLEAKRQERKTTRTAARDSALAALREAPTSADVETAWLRIQECFHELFATPDDVEPLRALVLQLAVRGRLVEQDPGDEPADASLACMRKERAKLVRDGRIRAGRPLAEGKIEDCPHVVPNGWAVCRLTDLGVFLGGKTPSTNVGAYWDGAIPWVSPKDMKVPLILDTEDHVSEKAIENGLPLIPQGSVLIVVRSGILRRMIPVAITSRESTINQDLKALWPFPSARADYISLMVKGFESYILEHLTKTGTTVESMKFEEFSVHPFPLPPEKEQRRILARVGELTSLLDRLSGSLSSQIEASDSFAAAAVHHLDA